MNKIVVAVFVAVVSAKSFSQSATIIHAPSILSQAEYERLSGLLGESQPVDNVVQQSPKGDLIIKVKGIGSLTISKDSELLGPIRLGRELLTLAKKYGEGKLIPFSELSEQSLTEYRHQLYSQFPNFDVGDKSCFTMQAMLGREVRTGSALVRTASAPSRFGGGPDRLAKRKEFDDLLNSAPLVMVRTDKELEEFWKKLPWRKEAVLYDGFSQLSTKLTLMRRALEIFQGWAQSEMDRFDREIQSLYATDKEWASIIQGKSARNADDLMRIAPLEFQELKSSFEENYKRYHFSSVDKATESLATAQISYRFHFTVRAAVKGLNRQFVFE